MSFSTYAGLQTYVEAQLARSDLSGYYNDFVTLFEASAARRLRIRPMQTTATLTPASGSANLPSDYLGYLRATVQSSPVIDMEYVDPSYLQSLFSTVQTGAPRYFTIEGSALKTRSSDTTSIEFLYYAKSGTLVSALNSLFTSHPDAYLFGVLKEAYAFNKKFDEAAAWAQRLEGAFQEISTLNFRERGSMAIRPIGAFP